MQPDTAFADALLLALARALSLVPPDEASELRAVRSEAQPVVTPYACTLWRGRGDTRIVPQIYIDGKRVNLGYLPYTHEGAALATRMREAAQAEKERGGDKEAVKRAAREAR